MSKLTLEAVRDAIRDAPYTPTHTHACALWADAIDAELKARGEPVFWYDTRGVGTITDDPELIPASQKEYWKPLYAALPAPKIEVDDAMASRLACWMISQDGANPPESSTHSDRLRWWHEHAKEALEAALKETP